MAAHACLKNEFTEDEKYHYLLRWLELSIWEEYLRFNFSVANYLFWQGCISGAVKRNFIYLRPWNRRFTFQNDKWAASWQNQQNDMYAQRNICNNDYGVNIGQVTSSRLCRRCTNLRILSGISGVSRHKQNESKISILGSQKSKKVTKILHSHQWNLYQFYQNKIL